MSIKFSIFILLSCICVKVFSLELSSSEVNFFALMSVPEKYQDKAVEVTGVIDARSGQRGYLYASKEHYKNDVYSNAIRVMFPEEFECNRNCGEYFTVFGTVRVNAEGRLLYMEDIQAIVGDGNYIWPTNVPPLPD